MWVATNSKSTDWNQSILISTVPDVLTFKGCFFYNAACWLQVDLAWSSYSAKKDIITHRIPDNREIVEVGIE